MSAVKGGERKAVFPEIVVYDSEVGHEKDVGWISRSEFHRFFEGSRCVLPSALGDGDIGVACEVIVGLRLGGRGDYGGERGDYGEKYLFNHESVNLILQNYFLLDRSVEK